MRTALALPDEGMKRLRDFVEPDGPTSAAAIDALIAAGDASLGRRLRQYVYAGREWTPAMRALLSDRAAAGERLALPPDLVE